MGSTDPERDTLDDAASIRGFCERMGQAADRIGQTPLSVDANRVMAELLGEPAAAAQAALHRLQSRDLAAPAALRAVPDVAWPVSTGSTEPGESL